MSVTYPGRVTPPPAQDNPNPNPGTALTVQVPVDADGNAAAIMFEAQYRSYADYLTYLNQTARYRPPLIPSGAAGSTTGFTSVTQIGAGAGTVTPQTVANVNTGSDANVVVKIILGGAVGVATFQWSNDGGATYGATIVTAATYQDPTSLITVAFVGVFVATDLYYFRATDTPIARYYANHDSSLIAAQRFNFGIDHHGFVNPQYQSFIEDWDFPPTGGVVGASAAQLTGYGRWGATIAGGGSSITWGSNLIGTTAGNYKSLSFIQAGTARLFSAVSFTAVAGSLWILEFAGQYGGGAGGGIGIGPSTAAPPVLGNGNGGNGIFRYEIGWGPGSPIGNNVRYFLNGRYVSTAANPLSIVSPQFLVAQGTLLLGPLTFRYQSDVNPLKLGNV